MQAIPAAVHGVTLSGQTHLIHEKLTNDVPIQVRTMAYRYLMVYGRLEAFERIKELSSDPGMAVVLSSVESPRHMEDWTANEQEAICPWAVTFLEDDRAPVAGNAMAVLSNCAGEQLDALLERIDQTLEDEQFSFIHSTALRETCERKGKSKERDATARQCKHVRKLQERASLASEVQPRVRAMSLSNVAYTWPDKESLKLAKVARLEPQLESSAR